MRHSSTQQLHAYWLRQRDERPAPLRSAIEPAAIAGLLGDIFILDASTKTNFPLRLAGTRFCANLGRELTGANFLSLWQGDDRTTVAETLSRVADEAAAAVVDISAHTGRGGAVPIEMILLPVSQDGRHQDRILGLFTPMERPYWLGLHPLARLQVAGTRWLPNEPTRSTATRPLPAMAPAPLREMEAVPAAPPAGRRHQHLVVLDGGRD